MMRCKIIISITVFPILIASFCKKGNDSFIKPPKKPKYAIIAASLLRCRIEPATDSQIVIQYPYGAIKEVSDSKETKEGIWYQNPDKKCWLHSQYLLLTALEEFTKLSPEYHHCLATEYEIDLPIYLIGNLYIKPKENFSWTTPSPIIKQIEIGTFDEIAGNIIFSPYQHASYDPVGHWIGISSELKKWELFNQKDNKGSYYSLWSLTREKAKETCDANPSGDLDKGTAATFYIKEKSNQLSINKEVSTFKQINLISEEEFEKERIECRKQAPISKMKCQF